MPTEAFIRKMAVKRLRDEGYVVWWPERSKSFGPKDIFTVFDLVCQRPGYYITRYIQLTDSRNHSARRKKVMAYLDRHDLLFWCEVWSWSDRLQTFRIEEIDVPTTAKRAREVE